ncbi:PREDICTED: semaphorin-4A, partial [Chaetura pelagica]|uniref:semaphorin-4A n=1 Tax=Chaetura pelagica TaxID=8897 RepID=UPI0005236BEC
HLENFTLVSSGRGQPFLDGKGQCPFDPQHTYTALLVDGELYTGTMNNFLGNEPIISRSLGSRTQLKTDAFLRWLSDPLEHREARRRVKNDVGGDKVLQKKWTTFLKAQLVCSQPGHFPFNVIHHAFLLPRRNGSESSRWTVYGGAEMNPRPGSCYMGPSSDIALTFMKEHFLMDGKVMPTQGQVLLVKTDVTYTRIVVDETPGVSGVTYRVMFLATAEGFLHKVVELLKSPHIVESIQLFGTPEPVKNLLLAPGKGILYVGYSGGVLQVPLANCSLHRSCAECVLARDPYCAWHSREGSCQPIRATTDQDMAVWLQDVEAGRAAPLCQQGRNSVLPRAWGGSEEPPAETLSPQLNTVVHLLCPQPSAMATYTWQQPGDPVGHHGDTVGHHGDPVEHREDPVGHRAFCPGQGREEEEEEEEEEGSRACCLQLDGDVDAENNRVCVTAGEVA